MLKVYNESVREIEGLQIINWQQIIYFAECFFFKLY